MAGRHGRVIELRRRIARGEYQVPSESVATALLRVTSRAVHVLTTGV